MGGWGWGAGWGGGLGREGVGWVPGTCPESGQLTHHAASLQATLAPWPQRHWDWGVC